MKYQKIKKSIGILLVGILIMTNTMGGKVAYAAEQADFAASLESQSEEAVEESLTEEENSGVMKQEEILIAETDSIEETDSEKEETEEQTIEAPSLEEETTSESEKEEETSEEATEETEIKEETKEQTVAAQPVEKETDNYLEYEEETTEGIETTEEETIGASEGGSADFPKEDQNFSSENQDFPTEVPSDVPEEQENFELFEEDFSNVTAFSASRSMSGMAFTTTNVRTSETINFRSDSGKIQVLIFGGIGSCYNTFSGLDSFSKLTESMDLSKIDLYAIDVMDNSTSTILSGTENISDAIQIAEMNSEVESVYYAYFRNIGLSSYSMPLALYLDAEGEVYTYSTGIPSLNNIKSNLEKGGIAVEIKTQRFRISGKASYSYAYEILEILNQERTERGLSALQMDRELLEAAMQRAAECAIFYSHERPDGTHCFSISSKMSRENIAAGYLSPADVMNGWMNSTGHFENIMATDNQSVGIGCIYHEGYWFWVQCFGRGTADTLSQPKDINKMFEIDADEYFSACLDFDSGNSDILAGEKYTLDIYLQNPGWNPAVARIDNTSYQWNSSNSAIATVDANGIVTGISAGTATITGTNIGGKGQTLYKTVTIARSTAGGKTGWVIVDGKWYYLDGNGVARTGWIIVDGKWYYLDSYGVMQTGWEKVGGKWYYLDSYGVMQTGWKKLDGKWYYLDSYGVMQTGWKRLSGKWYYLDSYGVMQTSWKKLSGKWYYLDSYGVMQTGWKKLSGKWYYLDSYGVMQTGWKKLSGKWYYLDSYGVMQVGWEKVSEKWYYLDNYGVMQIGWENVGEKWYYLDSYGVMQTGWEKVGGRWYYLDKYGVMQTGWEKVSGKWYYLNSYGVMQTGWLKSENNWYYLLENGVMVTEDTVIDGRKNRFNENGVWLGTA